MIQISSKHFLRAACLVLLGLPLAAFADVTGTPNLPPGAWFNFDTGVAGTSNGDIMWSGTTITPEGSALAVDLTTLTQQGGTSFYNTVSSSLVSSLFITASANAFTPAANDVILVKTNGGNFAKILVQTISAGTLTFQFDTFVTSTSTNPTAPNIAAVVNNYSSLPAGLPNYGIAPGSLMVIYGTNLGTTNVQEKFPLQTTLNATSTTNGTSVSVTVNGVTVQPGLYYVYPTQIAAVLPSTTPVGQATVTVTNGSQPSNAFTFQVVQSAVGIDTVYGTGSGQAVVTDANYNLIGYSASASPGETLIIWGSGVGADTKNDDKTYPAPNLDNLTNIPMQAYIGGISANIIYRGRSQYPGVDQIIVTVPANVTPGCNVSIVLVSGANSTASNFATIAVNPNGGACSDPNTPVDITGVSGDSTVSFGDVFVSVSVNSESTQSLARSPVHVRPTRPFIAKPGPEATTTDTAAAIFESVQGSEFGNYASYETASVGSCVVYQESSSSTTTTPFQETGLDAGTIAVTGPSGSATLTEVTEALGFYDASLSSSFIPTQGGSFTFNGSGGKNIGPFSATVTMGSPLFSWTNMAAITAVTRSSGVNVTWQGGQSGTYVEIAGFADGSSVGAGFYCLALQDALQFTVPSWVLLSLPAGQGDLDVVNISKPVSFSATGLNFGNAFAEVDNITQVSYN